MYYLSKYYKNLKTNITNELYGFALKREDCIFLTGSCPTPTPEPVYEGLFKSFKENNKFCSYNTGSLSLKAAILEYMKKHNEIEVDPKKNILITSGATNFLQQLFFFLLDEDTESIVITPTFQDYYNQLRFTRTNIVEVAMEEKQNEWILDLEKVRNAITPKTKIILICSPNNPTGKVYSKEVLTKLGLICKQNNILLVADEAYNYLTYGQQHTSLLNIPKIKNNIVVARTFSKEFSMCGWRIGYSYLPEEIFEDMFHLQLSFNNVASAVSQKAAEISLKNEDVLEFAKQETKRIEANRDFVRIEIDKIGKDLSYILPKSCPYFFVKYGKNISSYDLCKDMIEKKGVIVSPGLNNGLGGEGHFCITFADDISVLKEGMRRISEYFQKYY
jgi:aspartate/methionine/tyrosine aminotransferase